jgi:hypothetical protein
MKKFLAAALMLGVAMAGGYALAGVWYDSNGGSHSTLDTTRYPSAWVLTNRSGTIIAGSVSQQIMAANSGRHGCWIQNQSSADMWINELGSPATGAQPAIWVPPGAVWRCEDSGLSLTAINIISPFTGGPFAAREW